MSGVVSVLLMILSIACMFFFPAIVGTKKFKSTLYSKNKSKVLTTSLWISIFFTIVALIMIDLYWIDVRMEGNITTGFVLFIFFVTSISAFFGTITSSVGADNRKKIKKAMLEEMVNSGDIPATNVTPTEVKEVKTSLKKGIAQKCPNCGAKLTDLNFYKLKSGTDTRCDYCDEIILSGD